MWLTVWVVENETKVQVFPVKVAQLKQFSDVSWLVRVAVEEDS